MPIWNYAVAGFRQKRDRLAANGESRSDGATRQEVSDVAYEMLLKAGWITERSTDDFEKL